MIGQLTGRSDRPASQSLSTPQASTSDGKHYMSDDYEVFLDSWSPSELLRYATISSNLQDPLVQQRLLDDSAGNAKLARTPNVVGPKLLGPEEAKLRAFDFFEEKKTEWSADFRERLEQAGINRNRVNDYIENFAKIWTDGKSDRQFSAPMMGIKASIRDHDRTYCPSGADLYVINKVDDTVKATFTPEEVREIFEINSNMLEIYVADYLANFDDSSINNFYVRRGVCMPEHVKERIELHYLSSYSVALAPVEQFAQQIARASKTGGVPSIFAAPLPALQKRVLAFAPFIEGMSLLQLELVVAPPIERTPLISRGQHGGIEEYDFI